VLAHHYTEAGLIGQAIPYWQRAGQRAVQRSANSEAISHLTKALEVLKTLPDTPERSQHELRLLIALGIPLIATEGYGALAVERTYARALELCRQMGETPQLFPVLGGLCSFYQQRAELKTARELAEQLLRLAQSEQDPARLLWAHVALGETLRYLGELPLSLKHLQQSLALYNPQQGRSYGFVYNPRVLCLSTLVLVLYTLGYPDQALKRSDQALTLARELSQPYSLVIALSFAALVRRMRGELQAAQELEEATTALSHNCYFPKIEMSKTELAAAELATKPG